MSSNFLNTTTIMLTDCRDIHMQLSFHIFYTLSFIFFFTEKKKLTWIPFIFGYLTCWPVYNAIIFLKRSIYFFGKKRSKPRLSILSYSLCYSCVYLFAGLNAPLSPSLEWYSH